MSSNEVNSSPSCLPCLSAAALYVGSISQEVSQLETLQTFSYA